MYAHVVEIKHTFVETKEASVLPAPNMNVKETMQTNICKCGSSCACDCQDSTSSKNENKWKCSLCVENKCEGKYERRYFCDWESKCACACREPRFEESTSSKNEKKGKCPPCAENKCEGKYERRGICQWESECTCACREPRFKSAFRAAASVIGGMACVAVGVGVTVLTVGMGAPVGGAIMGMGTSLVTHPISKAITKERMQDKELLKDIAVSATVGGLSSGIGAIGGSLFKVASTGAKVGVQMATSAVAGGAAGAVSETARLLEKNGHDSEPDSKQDSEKDSDKKELVKTFAKSIAVGAVFGAIGGAASRAATNISSKISNDVGRAATRVAVQATAATATDAGVQLCENGGDIKKLDFKRLTVTATSQLAVGTTSECTRSHVMKSRMYTDKLNKLAVDKMDLPQETKDAILERANEANNLSPETTESELRKVSEYDRGKSSETKLAKIGDNNAHFLTDDRKGQIALDIKDENGNRGARRVVLDFDSAKKRYVIADYTETHDYKNMKRFGENRIHDPSVEALGKLPANHFLNSADDDEDDEGKKKEKITSKKIT